MVESTGLAAPRRRIFVTVTSETYLPTLRKDAASGGVTNWSMSRRARRGDRLLLYVKAPVMAVVAEGFVAETPVLEDDPAATWYGQYFAEVYGLNLFGTFLPRLELRRQFYEWRYWRQPRQSVQVPADCEAALLELLGGYR